MEQPKRDKRHLVLGISFLIAGALFIYFGLTAEEYREDHTVSIRESIQIPNEGGELEGNAPLGFSSAGEGLFFGDNVNSAFPNSDGLAAYITFDIEGLSFEDVKTAMLFSGDVRKRGTPFLDLGKVVVEVVEYEEFSSKIWNTPKVDDACVVDSLSDAQFVCDVKSALERAFIAKKNSLQLRLRFENVSDEDGEPDLLMFNRGESNENEEGLFVLRINHPDDYEVLSSDEVIVVPLVVHQAHLNPVELDEVNEIFGQANIEFQIETQQTELGDDPSQYIGIISQEELSLHIFLEESIETQVFEPLYAVTSNVEEFPELLARLLMLEDFKDVRNFTEKEILLLRDYAHSFVEEIKRR